MTLLASNYDQSRHFNTENVTTEKKLRIKNASEELVGMGTEKEKKLVLWFTNDEHGLVLNRTNNRTIRSTFGDAVDGWTNKIIVLFPTQADFRGRMVPALRVRIPPPQQPPAAAPTAPQQPSSGNGTAAAPPDDPELQSGSLGEDMDDEIPF